MRNFLASAMIAVSAVLFVQPTIVSAQNNHHHHNRAKECKQSCKDEYNRCKHGHGHHCKEERHACERGCPK